MKIVLAGGTGFLGRLLVKKFLSQKHELVVLSRGGSASSQATLVPWDAYTLSGWAKEMDGADLVINLTGKKINCLFTEKNLKILRDSRIHSTQVIAQAINQLKNPPPLWIQMSAIDIYPHRFEDSNNEQEGGMGEEEGKVPPNWLKITELIQDWESAVYSAKTPSTRKVIARCSVVMSPEKKTAFDIFLRLARYGLGGSVAGGKQWVSWIHEDDFVRSIEFLIDNPSIHGPVNLSSPQPLPQKEFMKILRESWGIKWGLPAQKWMVFLASFFTQIEPVLVLKSRYTLPKILLDAGFSFQFPSWEKATKNLIANWKKNRE